MADRDRTDTPDRPFGADAAEKPHIDQRTGVRPGPAPAEAPDIPQAPLAREVEAGEVIHGDDRTGRIAPAGDAHTADHAASTPSGSDRTGIETPTDGKSRKLLIGAVVAVIVILLIMLLLPGEAEATSPLLMLWAG